MIRHALPALLLLLALTLLTGVVYPLAVTGLAALLFPERASGSLVRQGERILGSRLVGQPFSAPGHFWGRPSATPGEPYNGALSGGSNLSPSNPLLLEQVEDRIKALKDADPDNSLPVPVDLVTASASGLDPHISPAAADYQVPRVARARGLAEDAVRNLVRRHVHGRQLGFLGEPVVNVLDLNLELDQTVGAEAHPAP